MNPPDPAPPDKSHQPAPVDLSEESIAGEEDPGAALDTEPDPPAPRAAPSPAGGSGQG
ncbi:hypothetical protein [Piscinibacter sp. XHJ-5]|uniref:hypothetical protein n=1 Tax=Piscinibacter sp. XHJ-5 TaxID=3037797 RepID=UPI002453088F|nr:hypothetical protein [Piscinibacter sp. XHJ-5]